jgi:NAD:arginine ADP-ribosyltransferase
MAMKEDLETYVHTHLKAELDIIRRDFQHILPELSDEKKAIIYKYTSDDEVFTQVNKILRYGKRLINNELANYLETALKELPNHKDLVYRGSYLSSLDVDRYEYALKNNTILVEYSFLSASLKKGIAESFGDVLFKIFGKTCKLIEKVSKFGSQSVDNEQEVVFLSGTSFRVLEISRQQHYIIITLREV